MDRKLSKIETLRLATKYIEHLSTYINSGKKHILLTPIMSWKTKIFLLNFLGFVETPCLKQLSCLSHQQIDPSSNIQMGPRRTICTFCLAKVKKPTMKRQQVDFFCIQVQKSIISTQILSHLVQLRKVNLPIIPVILLTLIRYTYEKWRFTFWWLPSWLSDQFCQLLLEWLIRLSFKCISKRPYWLRHFIHNNVIIFNRNIVFYDVFFKGKDSIPF